MTNQRISVTKLRQLMQFESSELTMRDIGRALQLSAGAVSKYRCAVRIAGLTWNDAQHLRIRSSNVASGKLAPSGRRGQWCYLTALWSTRN